MQCRNEYCSSCSKCCADVDIFHSCDREASWTAWRATDDVPTHSYSARKLHFIHDCGTCGWSIAVQWAKNTICPTSDILTGSDRHTARLADVISSAACRRDGWLRSLRARPVAGNLLLRAQPARVDKHRPAYSDETRHSSTSLKDGKCNHSCWCWRRIE